ncbi:hypothetical protein GQX73_g10592 [Xylaria multiplex]|uniref:VWFA domain-containing protein n=1 Tax=Xylaria multiplex TaxID=323545 RepID=A0A7C8IJA1_9PEZI|nr:hypothetical protein GQX73_g10592 [Xylaria multiplex]
MSDSQSIPLLSDGEARLEGGRARNRFFKWVRNGVTWARGQLRQITKNVTDILIKALKRLIALIMRYPDKSGQMEQVIDNPQTAKDFKQNLDIIIKESGLSGFFSESYLEEVAAKAATLRNDENNLLREPGQVTSLTKLALYQPVLFCDRKSAQVELVKRIASIATRAVPRNEGIYLRFINKAADTLCDNLSKDEIEAKMQFEPEGRTFLGQNLKAKILKPLVYNVIGEGQRLERPLLILTITDGCPDAPDTFRAEIGECGKYLVKNHYQKTAVRFNLSQIGSDKKATQFLNGLLGDESLKDVLHCTAEHLDAKFGELRKNEQEIEEWLLEILKKPIEMKPLETDPTETV